MIRYHCVFHHPFCDPMSLSHVVISIVWSLEDFSANVTRCLWLGRVDISYVSLHIALVIKFVPTAQAYKLPTVRAISRTRCRYSF